MTTEELQARINSVDRRLSEVLDEAKKKKKKPYDNMRITTGDIDYNIRQFNKRMGTDFPGNDNNNPSTVEAQKATGAASNATTVAVCGDASNAGGTGSGIGEDLLVGKNFNAFKLAEAATISRANTAIVLYNDDDGEWQRVRLLVPYGITEKEIEDKLYDNGFIGVTVEEITELTDPAKLQKLQHSKAFDIIEVLEVSVKEEAELNAEFAEILGESFNTLAKAGSEFVGDFVERRNGMSKNMLQESSLVINRVEFETESGRKELEFRWDKGDTYRVSLLSIKDGIGKEDWSKVYYDKDQAERRYKKEVAKAKKEYQLENEYTFKPLTEAKREVTRYYIRPQNIWCSNKAEILKALIEMGEQNCSVYTLKNLEDNKDVHKLTTDDIIYYYDNHILYDKNHVPVMDYDLFVKHEEERKKFAGGIDTVPEDTFRQEYEDRMTDKTIVESIENPLRDAVNDSVNYFVNSQGITPDVDDVMEDITWNVPGFEDWRKIMPDETEKIKNIKFLISKYMNELTEDFTDKPKKKIKEARISDKALDAAKYAYGFNDKTAKKFVRQADDSLITELIKEFEITGKHDFYEANTEDTQEETNLNEIVNNPFDLAFESYNAFGKRIVEGKEVDDTCCICGEPLEDYGNNPAPYKEEGRCCDNCNVKFVIPARLEQIKSNKITEQLDQSAKTKFKVVMHFPEAAEPYTEYFNSEEEVEKYLNDSYDNWCADDPEIAEEIIYPLLCDFVDKEDWEVDGNGIIVFER